MNNYKLLNVNIICQLLVADKYYYKNNTKFKYVIYLNRYYKLFLGILI